MTAKSVENIVIDLIRTKLDDPKDDVEITADTVLSTLAMDSLKLVEILFELEMLFDMVADEDQIALVQTAGDMARLFENATVPV